MTLRRTGSRTLRARQAAIRLLVPASCFAAVALHREAYAVRDGVRLHYLTGAGSGEPAVFRPGLRSTAHTFDEFAPRLQGRYRPIAITRHGFGQSGRPPVGYDTPTHAADGLAVLDALGFERATLVGQSLGGAEAVWLAVHHMERVRRVVLLASYCFGCPQAMPPHTSPPAWDIARATAGHSCGAALRRRPSRV